MSKTLPIFLDGHDLHGIKPKELMNAANASTDKHGVRILQLLFSENDDKLYCILDGPNEESVRNHHKDLGFSCDFVTKVDHIKDDNLQKIDKLIAVGEIASMVAHDVLNPLTSINNAVRLIETKHSENIDDDLKKTLNIIKSSSEKMKYRMSGVLDFVRVKPLHVQPISVLKLLEMSKNSSRFSDSINFVFPTNDATIHGDVIQLEIVLNNLFNNSIQAIDDRPGTIVVSLMEAGNNIVLRIRDSGPGIPIELMGRIFDVLYSTKHQGTGLGLASCKTIVEQHEGKIESIPSNHGAVFQITLPKKQNK